MKERGKELQKLLTGKKQMAAAGTCKSDEVQVSGMVCSGKKHYSYSFPKQRLLMAVSAFADRRQGVG